MATYTGIKKIKIGDNTFELAVDWSNVTNPPTIPVDTDKKVRTSVITSASSIYLAGPTTNSSTTGELNVHNGLHAQFSAASTSGYINLIIGGGNAGEGCIRLYGSRSGSSQYYTTLEAGTPTANRTLTLPNKTGTVALTSDILTKTSQITNDSNFITRASTFTGATSSAAGTAGTIPAPAAGDTQKVVFGDGNWWNIGLETTLSNNNTVLRLVQTRTGSGGAGTTLEVLGTEVAIPTQTSQLSNDSGFFVSQDGVASTIFYNTDLPTETDGLDGDFWFVYIA